MCQICDERLDREMREDMGKIDIGPSAASGVKRKGEIEMDELLKKIVNEGGCIVSTTDCGAMEIAAARSRGDFYVDERGIGYVRRLPDWLKKHSRFARGADKICCEGV